MMNPDEASFKVVPRSSMRVSNGHNSIVPQIQPHTHHDPQELSDENYGTQRKI